MNRNLNASRILALPLAAFLSASSWASPLQPLATVDPTIGPPRTGGGDSWGSILTPDGRYVLFASTANNLASGSNGVYQPLVPAKVNVFRRDRASGATILVSVNVSGVGGGNGDSIPTALSTNGQYALFESTASDLVANDTNNASDVFLRDLVKNETFLVSVNTNGQSANGASQSSVMTPDGRYVAFSSLASDLATVDFSGAAEIYVRDMLAGSTTLASPGARPGNSCDGPELTPDGQYLAYLNFGDVYVRDLVGLSTVNVSQRSVTDTPYFYFNQAISDDGQYVAFELGGPSGTIYRYNLLTRHLDVVGTAGVTSFTETADFRTLDMTPDGRFVTYLSTTTGASPSSSSVNVWDGQSNSTRTISGQPGVTAEKTSVCAFPVISSNGQYVAFLSSSAKLTAITSNTLPVYHLYLWNAETGSNSLIDLEPGGQVSADTFMSKPCITPDGRFIAFDATDSNLGGDPRPGCYNVYLSDQTTNGLEVISSRQPSMPSATASTLSIGSGFSISSNGQYAAYSCMANRLSADGNATNTFTYVYVSDMVSGSNIIVGVDTNNIADPNGVSSNPALSADGRYVVFTSLASNLVTNTLVSRENVFIRDLQTGTTTLVSTNGYTNFYPFLVPLVDASGRYVLYPTTAASGVQENLLFRDLQAGNTFQLPVGYSGLVPAVTAAAMTPDGHFVAFAGLTQTVPNLYQVGLWDSHANALVYATVVSSAVSTIIDTMAVSVTSIAVSPDGNRLAYISSNQLSVVDRAAGSNWVVATSVQSYRAGPQFSGDGRYLVYATSAALAANDTNGVNDIYRYDFQSKANVLISQSGLTGAAGNGASDWPTISGNGRFVAYRSVATDLVPGGASAFPQIYLYDSQSNTTTLVSASALAGGGGNNRSLAPIFSADSTTLLFRTWASDLLTNDFSGSGGIDAMTVAVYPPALLGAIQISPSGFPIVSFPAVAGTAYQVQYKNNLADPLWLPLPGTITTGNNTATITDSSKGAQRFYRVQSN